jgi:hypothetical protein
VASEDAEDARARRRAVAWTSWQLYAARRCGAPCKRTPDHRAGLEGFCRRPAAARTLAALAAGGLLVVLVGSVALLVPIQRRLVASESPPLSAVEALRARWCGGHLVRTAVALACFVLAVVATII